MTSIDVAENHSDRAVSPAPLLRPAVADDALCLSVLAMQVFLDTYAPKGISPSIAREALIDYSEQVFSQAMDDPASRLWVAEVHGHLVGFMHLIVGRTHELAPQGAQSELFRLYIQEPFTGKLVGSQLLAAAERLAVEAGASVLWLTPWVHNHRALQFYQRRGYRDFGLTQFVFEGESFDNRLYAKALIPTWPDTEKNDAQTDRQPR